MKKKNLKVHFSSKTDMWSTPQWLFDELNKEFNFDLDVCATKQNAKCKKYFTKKQNGLKQNWALPWFFITKGTDFKLDSRNYPTPFFFEKRHSIERIPNTVWMNPPYGKEIGKWVKKAYEESQKGCIVVALLPARTDTKYFHEYIYNKPNISIRFIKGRLKFGNAKNSAPFPSMIVIFGDKA